MARKMLKSRRTAILHEPDDLTRIKGIGPAIATYLQDTGIHTFAQLAELTPEEISARVSGLSSKRITRERWIKQAQKQATKTASVVFHVGETGKESQQHYATFTVELLLGENNKVRRTRVTYIQNKLEESWADWAEPKLVSFITKCAGLRLPLPEKRMPHTRDSEVSSKEYIPKPKIRIESGGVLRVGKLITTSPDSDMLQFLVHADEAFSVHILLDITEAKTESPTPLICKVTIWAKKLGTGVRQIIGERQTTLKPVDKIPFVMECSIPSEGTYRLEAVATLSPASTFSSPHSTIRTWKEGGLLQVV